MGETEPCKIFYFRRWNGQRTDFGREAFQDRIGGQETGKAQPDVAGGRRSVGEPEA